MERDVRPERQSIGWVSGIRALAAVAAVALPASAGSPGTDVFVPLAEWDLRASPSGCCTTVAVHNPGVAPVEVRFLPVEPERERAAAAPRVATLAPGETRRLGDATRLLSAGSPCGALRVVAPARLIVSWTPCAAAAASPADGNPAESKAAIPSSLAIGVGERTEIFVESPTGSAAQRPARRRLTVVEVTGNPVRVRVTPQDAGGAELAPSREHNIGPLSLRRLVLDEEFPTLDGGAVRWSVAPISGAGKVLCFGGAPAAAGAEPTPGARSVVNEGKAPPAAGSAGRPAVVGRRQ